jgi:hypothetical protein
MHQKLRRAGSIRRTNGAIERRVSLAPIQFAERPAGGRGEGGGLRREREEGRALGRAGEKRTRAFPLAVPREERLRFGPVRTSTSFRYVISFKREPEYARRSGTAQGNRGANRGTSIQSYPWTPRDGPLLSGLIVLKSGDVGTHAGASRL